MKDYKKKIDNLMAAVNALEWRIIIMADPSMERVPGLVIGEDAFLKNIKEILEALGSAVNTPIENITDKAPKSKLKPKKNSDDPTFH